MKNLLALACLSVLGGPTAVLAQGSGDIVRDQLACPTCTVEMEVFRTLGTIDGAGMLPSYPLDVERDGSGSYWVAFGSSSVPLVFTPWSADAQPVGRMGAGPGEFRAASQIEVIGDTMMLVDGAQGRLTLVRALDRQPIRYMPTQARLVDLQVLDWPRNVVFNAIVPTRALAGWPFHRFDLSGSEPLHIRSFGSGQGELRPGDNASLVASLSDPRDGTYWAVQAIRYELVEYDTAGNVLRRLNRSTDWFPDRSHLSLGNPEVPPFPMITGISEDEDGLLWVYASVPRKDWRSAWTGIRIPSSGEVRGRDLPPRDSFYETRIEIIDPVRSVVVASLTTHGIIASPTGPREAALYRSGQSGEPLLDIVRFDLVGYR